MSLYIGILPSRNILIGDFNNTFYRNADGTQTIGIFYVIYLEFQTNNYVFRTTFNYR